MLRRLDDWSKQIDPELLRAAFSPGQILSIAVFVLGVVALDALVPAAHGVLELRSGGLLFAVTPVWLITLGLSAAWVRGRLRGRAAPIGLIVGGGCVAFVSGAMVAFSSERASPLFGALLIITGLAHGFQARSTVQYPFIAIADGIAFTLAALFARETPQLVVLGVASPAGILGGLLLGSATVHSERLRAERERMRHALEAQIARERAKRVDEVRGFLVDAHARAHDVRNALMGALAALDGAVTGYRGSGDARRELERARNALRTAIDITRPAPSSSPTREPVRLEASIERALEVVRPRFRHVQLAIEARQGAGTTVEVDGGVASLDRILTNLLVNACEGDGKRAAAHVRVVIEQLDDPAMTIIGIEDDGPGFSKEQLDAPITGFHSTKAEGTGLGLFTVDRLAGASGGWVERANASERGAIVRVVLPRAELRETEPSREQAEAR